MFNFKMWFINWLCCTITGMIVSLILIALFGAIIPTTFVYAACAAAGWVTSLRVMRWFNHLD